MKTEARLGADWFIAAGAYPSFCSMKRLGVNLFPMDGILVHRRSLPGNLIVRFPQQFASAHLYTWVERGTVRVKCLAQEQNALSYLPTQIRFLIGGERTTWHWSKLNDAVERTKLNDVVVRIKLNDALGQQHLELSTRT